MDCPCTCYFRRMESHKSRYGCLSFFIFADHWNILSGMGSVRSGPGIPGGAVSIDDFCPFGHVFGPERICAEPGRRSHQNKIDIGVSFRQRSNLPGQTLQAGQTHLNPNAGRTLHDGVYLFPTD